MNIRANRDQGSLRVVATGPIEGHPLRIGAGFAASSFRHAQFAGRMDPLVMVDHYTMTEPTFGPHAHAGMSAVSILFEDSEGLFHNRDSLGNDIDLEPGDLYWLAAGRGAVHDERPRAGARTHGLQVFVNLPARLEHAEPDALHVRAAQMPVVEGEGARVRVVLGETNGTAGARSPALPMTILDAHLEGSGRYSHALPSGVQVWVYAVDGEAELAASGSTLLLEPGKARALRVNAAGASLELRSKSGAHIVLIQGEPLGEPIVQRGPFVMSTVEALEKVTAAYAGVDFGSLL